MTESMVFNPRHGITTEYEKAYRWGEFFHVVTLKDGRDIGLSADKVVVTDNGDFIALSTAILDESTMNRVPFSTPKTILSLAKGEWISFYSASAMTGDPLGIEWTEAVKE
jgi:hypothetical protein